MNTNTSLWCNDGCNKRVPLFDSIDLKLFNMTHEIALHSKRELVDITITKILGIVAEKGKEKKNLESCAGKAFLTVSYHPLIHCCGYVLC